MTPPADGPAMATDADDAAFTCPFCGRGFDGQDALTDHFAAAHDFDGVG